MKKEEERAAPGNTANTAMAVIATIAVIDDDDGVRAALSNLLDSAGYRSCVFAAAEQFLHHHCLHDALCAVVDVELASMSGFALHQQLQSTRPGLPLIFMSAHGSTANQQRAAELGAAPLLVKPVDADTLLAHIRQVAAQ